MSASRQSIPRKPILVARLPRAVSTPLASASSVALRRLTPLLDDQTEDSTLFSESGNVHRLTLSHPSPATETILQDHCRTSAPLVDGHTADVSITAKRRRNLTATGNHIIASSSRTPLLKRPNYDCREGDRISQWDCKSDHDGLRQHAGYYPSISSSQSDSATPPPLSDEFNLQTIADEDVPTSLKTRLVTTEVLRDWIGWEDLDLVLSAEFKVDATVMIGVDRIGSQLPLLTSLKLCGSRIPSVRLLGTGYTAVRYLWLSNCHVQDLRGIGVCTPSLVELYASFNSIRDVSPLLDLSDTLEVLDLEGNDLQEVQALQFVLSIMKHVHTLNLQGNLVTRKTQGLSEGIQALGATPLVGAGLVDRDEDLRDFADISMESVLILRQWVMTLMPNLRTFDDVPLVREVTIEAGDGDDSKVMRPTTSRHVRDRLSHVYVDPTDVKLSEELRLVQDCIREDNYNDLLTEAVEAPHRQLYSRPSTSCAGARLRLKSAGRKSQLSGGTTTQSLGSTTGGTPLGVDFECIPQPPDSQHRNSFPCPSATSNLTTGSIFAGSAIANLRRRLDAQCAPPPVLVKALPQIGEEPAGWPSSSNNNTSSHSEAAALVRECLRHWMEDDSDIFEDHDDLGDTVSEGACKSVLSLRKTSTCAAVLSQTHCRQKYLEMVLAEEREDEPNRSVDSTMAFTGSRPPRPTTTTMQQQILRCDQEDAIDALVKCEVRRSRALIAQSASATVDELRLPVTWETPTGGHAMQADVLELMSDAA